MQLDLGEHKDFLCQRIIDFGIIFSSEKMIFGDGEKKKKKKETENSSFNLLILQSFDSLNLSLVF